MLAVEDIPKYKHRSWYFTGTVDLSEDSLILLIKKSSKVQSGQDADNEDRIANCLLKKFISHLPSLLTFFVNTLFISMLYVFKE